MNPEEVASLLLVCGWMEISNSEIQRVPLSRDDKRKARCFRSSRSHKIAYLKVKPLRHATPRPWPIVIAAEDEKLARAVAPAAIHFKDSPEHGSMYGRFSTRRNRAKDNREEHYGIALATHDMTALRAFFMAYDDADS